MRPHSSIYQVDQQFYQYKYFENNLYSIITPSCYRLVAGL